MSEKLVSIILLTWNGKRFIAPCLEAVASQDYTSIEFIIVDNGSIDGSLDELKSILKSDYPVSWKLESLPHNTGFAYGMNRGIAHARGKYILTLNQDLVMESSFISKMVQEMESEGNTHKGSATGKILKWSLDTNNRTKIIDSAGHVIFSDRIVEARGKDKPSEMFDEQCSVFGVSASAGFYLKDALRDVSPDGEVFDKEFFSYLEDVDLDYRLLLSGYEARYVPDAIAWHAGAGSGGRKSFKIRFRAYTNRYLIWIKNERFFELMKDLFPIMGQEIFQLIRTLFTSPLLLFAWFWFPVRAGRVWKKRKIAYSRKSLDYERLRNFIERGRLMKKLMST